MDWQCMQELASMQSRINVVTVAQMTHDSSRQRSWCLQCSQQELQIHNEVITALQYCCSFNAQKDNVMLHV